MKKSNNKFESNKKYFTISIYAIIVILISVVMIRLIMGWEDTKAMLEHLVATLSPFIWGFILAYMIDPLNKWFYNRVLTRISVLKSNPRIRQILSIMIAYLIVFGMIIWCLFYVIPQIVDSLLDLLDQIAPFYTSINRWVTNFVNHNEFIQDNTDLRNWLNTNLPNVFQEVTQMIADLVPKFYALSVSVVKGAINFIIAVVISVYLIWDKGIIIESVRRVIDAFFSESHAKDIKYDIRACHRILGSYFIGKAIDSLIIGILCFIFMLIFNMPYAVLVSVIVGITNMIPYFGPFIGAIPSAVIILMVSPYKMIGFVVLILVLQQLDGIVIGPKILGDSTGVRPIGILFAITIGGAFAGVLGMFLGVPILAIIQMLFERVVNRRLKSKQQDV
ncbi:MAG: AI-2E family transporter [Lachnospiraceae bacterium]